MTINKKPDLGLALLEAGWPKDYLFLTQEFRILRIRFIDEIAVVESEVKLGDDYLPGEFHYSKYEFKGFFQQFKVIYKEYDIFDVVDTFFSEAESESEFTLPFDSRGGLESQFRWVLYGFPVNQEPKQKSQNIFPLVSSDLSLEIYWNLNEDTFFRPLSIVAAEICCALIHDQKSLPEAMPYINAMLTLNNPEDQVGSDSAETIADYALLNMRKWRTVLGKRYREELQMIVNALSAKSD